MGANDVWIADEGSTVTAFVAQRAAVAGLCDGLTEEQARRRLVPSGTTLLGIRKHAVRVEKVWSLEAVAGVDRHQQGLQTNEDSFHLAEDDTVASVLAEFEAAVARSREVVSDLAMDAVASGWVNGGPMTLQWVLCHLSRSTPATSARLTSCAGRSSRQTRDGDRPLSVGRATVVR